MKQAVPSSPIILPSLTLYHSFHSWRVWTVFFCISCTRFTDWLIEQFTFKTERVDLALPLFFPLSRYTTLSIAGECGRSFFAFPALDLPTGSSNNLLLKPSE